MSQHLKCGFAVVWLHISCWNFNQSRSWESIFGRF